MRSDQCKWHCDQEPETPELLSTSAVVCVRVTVGVFEEKEESAGRAGVCVRPCNEMLKSLSVCAVAALPLPLPSEASNDIDIEVAPRLIRSFSFP